MPRSGEQARRRLEQAALELYREQGFDRTTAAEVARRAGVTERTFFHHYADKREVLFGREEHLRGLLIAGIRAVPDGAAPLEVLENALRGLQEAMEDGRSYALPRHELVTATPALREREAAKLASLADTLASALTERRVDPHQAVLAAHAAMAAFHVASVAWFDDPSDGFAARLATAFDDLRAVCAPPRESDARPRQP